MKKNLNFVVKESITEALLRLMAKKNFDEINITAITELAGVSRISFYRNFDSKEDVLIKYMYVRAKELYKPFESQDVSVRDKLIGMFKSIEGMEDIINLLYAQNLSHIFLQYFNFVRGAKPEQENLDAYQNSIVVGVCFGALDEWIKRGRQETPEQMVDLLQNVIWGFVKE
ncbi:MULTISPECIES: TetR/AcrR family transcriptional regulator [Basfia]|uniref:AcrR protein n=2 Tax=Basfia TaxID=697331 RepID=Q65QE2_MANSM|nr:MULTISPECIES: TetR/AcrR family transcriptional regulator [Basfia]AAU38818.1 AcrR protein [[Mannheimia] succiniciproducens MBEL55E]QIM69342.1 AcrR family transcriptional regulator [Basfia succiniciproducens]SCY10209.1 transcriptional regulator, TetR family [Basfia succiniciproducens]SEQ23478.1 transcriptional regulator, TetR family [Basfia succiniciproducens]